MRAEPARALAACAMDGIIFSIAARASPGAFADAWTQCAGMSAFGVASAMAVEHGARAFDPRSTAHRAAWREMTMAYARVFLAWFACACACACAATRAWRGTATMSAVGASATLDALGTTGERERAVGRARRIVIDGVCRSGADVRARGGAWGAFIGAWAGAATIPLDWERPWQRWPVSVVRGICAGKLAGVCAAALYIVAAEISGYDPRGDVVETKKTKRRTSRPRAE